MRIPKIVVVAPIIPSAFLFHGLYKHGDPLTYYLFGTFTIIACMAAMAILWSET